jgi:pimeloyl-ACP methyl ester carboxylesterase
LKSTPEVRSQGSSTSVVREIRRLALAAAILVVLLCCIGATYQAIGTWRDSHRFLQHGRTVQAGNLQLNLNCLGEGRPTIILESGLGGPALEWARVQPEVALFAHVCSYDRAGYGWSEPGPQPRTSSQLAKELKLILVAADERGPYVLVGHFLGGFIVRVFTHLYPADVAGLVLVDASHEDEEDRINALLPDDIKAKEEQNDKWNAELNRVLTPLRLYLGIQRFEVAMGWAGRLVLPTELCRELLYLQQQPKTRNAIASESDSRAQSVTEVRKAGDFGDRPLIVLTAGIPYPPDPLLNKEQMERQNNLWINVLQVQEAHLSTRGKQIIVPDSTHMIPYDRPDAVISAIHGVWSSTRFN